MIKSVTGYFNKFRNESLFNALTEQLNARKKNMGLFETMDEAKAEFYALPNSSKRKAPDIIKVTLEVVG